MSSANKRKDVKQEQKETLKREKTEPSAPIEVNTHTSPSEVELDLCAHCTKKKSNFSKTNLFNSLVANQAKGKLLHSDLSKQIFCDECWVTAGKKQTRIALLIQFFDMDCDSSIYLLNLLKSDSQC